MKKYLFFIIIGIAAFTFTECGGNDESKDNKIEKNVVRSFDSTDLPTEKITDSDFQNDFRLAYNFEEGKTFRYKLTTLSNTKRTMETDSVVSNTIIQEISRIIRFETISVENDSIAELKCTVTDIAVNAKMNGQTFTYQSGGDLDSVDSKRYIEHEGLVNNPFRIRVTNHGELLDVYRADGIVNRLLELSGYKDSINIQQKAGYQNEIVNNLLNPMIQQVFRDFPVKMMNIDSTWDKNLPPVQVMVFSIGYTNHYTITGLEKLNDEKLALINGVSIPSIQGELKHSNNGVNYEFEKPVTEASGKIYFNLDRGLIHKSKTKTKLTINYSVNMDSPQGPQNGKITEKVSNDNILELL